MAIATKVWVSSAESNGWRVFTQRREKRGTGALTNQWFKTKAAAIKQAEIEARRLGFPVKSIRVRQHPHGTRTISKTSHPPLSQRQMDRS